MRRIGSRLVELRHSRRLNTVAYMRRWSAIIMTLFSAPLLAKPVCTAEIFSAGEKVPRSIMETALRCFDEKISTLESKITELQETINRNPNFMEGTTSRENSSFGATNEKTTKRISGYDFNTLGCLRASTLLKCTVRITNEHKEEREFTVFGHSGSRVSTLIDQDANQYTPKSVEFGAFSGRYSVNQILPASIPINITFSFEKVPQDIKSVALRLVALNNAEREPISITFKRIGVRSTQ